MKDHGFAEWWTTWPKNVTGGYQRKGGRSQCLQRWIKGLYWTQADTIIRHTEWMKTTGDWLKDRGTFIPGPLVYLNQQRWDGAEFELPVPAKEHVDPVLRQYAEHAQKSVPPSDEQRAKIAKLLGRRAQ